MSEEIRLTRQAPVALSGHRFDQVAAELFPQYSRARLQAWIRAGDLRLGGAKVKPNTRIAGGETLALSAQLRDEGTWLAQEMALDILYEDEDILVVNKAAGVVVHPAAGNPDGTLLNALLHHAPALAQVPRAGIVHRLDKDTTGLMVVAKTLQAQTDLVRQLQARTVGREYDALVRGELAGSGTVDAPIGRHPVHRKKMAVVASGGKPAVTHYRVVRRFGPCTHVRATLESGRTHQIRVHMAHLGYPLVGDPVYGTRSKKWPSGLKESMVKHLQAFPRQALHARRLSLLHPISGEPGRWETELPADIVGLFGILGADSDDGDQR